MATVLHPGHPVHTSGELPAVGARAPDFRLVDPELRDVTLATYRGQKKILNIVPSLDTSVCLLSARKFNERAGSVANAVVLVVSADLPFAMKRVCSVEGLDRVVALSMMRGRGFAKDYGVLLVDGPIEGISARAVVVLDERDTVLHAQLVASIGDEPDYEAALAAVAR